MFAPLVHALRGEYQGSSCVEAAHEGAFVIIDGRGSMVASIGDAAHPIHLRSAAKPFQLLPFLLRGLHRAKWKNNFAVEMSDLALMMSSHSGEDIHTSRVKELLRAADLDLSMLKCGVHAPFNEAVRLTLLSNHEQPTVLHNNCSGKHTAMLMTCRALNWPLQDYLDVDHPLQKEIVAILLKFSNQPRENIGFGIDGCSLPTFIMPLRALAQIYASLAYPVESEFIDAQNRLSLSMLFRAGTKYPEYLGGTKRLDTLLMQAAPGVLFAKTGAEGVFAMAVAPSERYPNGLGIALKIADGDPSSKIRSVVASTLLQRLGILSATRASWPNDLQKMSSDTLLNHRRLMVGSIEILF